jgi:two-component system, cell cycle response regulator
VKALVAEQDTAIRRVLETALAGWGHDVSCCADAVSALQSLEAAAPPFDYALLDASLSGLDDPEVYRAIRERGLTQTYVMLLAEGPAEQGLAWLEAGADDLLFRPVTAEMLELRLRAGRRVLDLRQALAEAQQTILVKSTQDVVTGLLNRETLIDTLDREMRRAKRDGMPLGVVLLDVDDFRLVNDNFGRAAGNGALRQIGQRLRRSLRPYDAVGRYGGNQFLVLLPGCDAATSQSLAERLQTAVTANPFKLDEGTVRLTVSLGVTSAGCLGEMQQADALLRAAEAALDKAKQPGQSGLAAVSKGAWLNLAM